MRELAVVMPVSEATHMGRLVLAPLGCHTRDLVTRLVMGFAECIARGEASCNIRPNFLDELRVYTDLEVLRKLAELLADNR
jgi:hypothetical protein